MSQTAYLNEPTVPGVGVLADNGDNDVVSRYSAAVIPFGRFLSYNAAEGKVKLPAAAGDLDAVDLEGVAVATQAIEDQPVNTLGVADADVPAYPNTMAINVLKRGRIWVYSEQAVTPLLAVFVRHTASGDDKPGNFRVDIDTANAVDISAKARWVSVTTAAGMALLDLRL
jgi:hypothetical protein